MIRSERSDLFASIVLARSAPLPKEKDSCIRAADESLSQAKLLQQTAREFLLKAVENRVRR